VPLYVAPWRGVRDSDCTRTHTSHPQPHPSSLSKCFVRVWPLCAGAPQKLEQQRLEKEEKKRVEALLASKMPGEIKLADFLDGGKGPGRRKKRRVRKKT
jgi:hypothetical protein